MSRSSPSETQIAFASIGDLFTPVVDETLPLLPGVQRRALEAALLIRESDGPPPEARVLGPRPRVGRARAHPDGPVLLAVDDAQWVDSSSAEVLRFLLRRLGDQPVGVLATVRGRPVEAPFELERAFTGLPSAHRPAAVRRGDPRTSSGASSSLPSRDPPSCACTPRPAATRSSPSSSAAASPTAPSARRADEVSLPDSLRAVVEQRLAALPSEIRHTLVAIAALSAPRVTLLEQLGGTTLDDLDVAASRDVITFDGDRVRFTHPLLAPACYALLPQHQRRRVHRRLADLDVDPEEKARHLALATPRHRRGHCRCARRRRPPRARPGCCHRLRRSSPSARSR